MKKVIIDTSAWINFFRLPNSKEKKTIDKLLDDNRAVMVGVVLSEILQGVQSEKVFDTLLLQLSAVPYYETTNTTWANVGRISMRLRKKGKIIPITDIVVAALALENGCSVYTLDKHFNAIREVEQYRL